MAPAGEGWASATICHRDFLVELHHRLLPLFRPINASPLCRLRQSPPPSLLFSVTLMREDFQAIYSAIALIHLPDIFPTLLPPPTRYPDLYIVLNVLLSFGVFGAAWLWGIKRLVEGAWAIRGLGDGAGRKGRKKVE